MGRLFVLVGKEGEEEEEEEEEGGGSGSVQAMEGKEAWGFPIRMVSKFVSISSIIRESQSSIISNLARRIKQGPITTPRA